MTSTAHSLSNRRPEVLFGILVFFSGMAALVHQLLWTRRLIDLLGASGESTARVFGTFFLGLSIGSAIAALLVGRTRNPLRLAGLVQLSIPLLVIPVIYLSELTDWIWPIIGADATHGSNGYAIKSLLTLGLVFPPSAMMGLSFPLIVAGLLRLNGGQLGRSGINLYAINTIGGAFGILFAVLVAIPQWGNFASMVVAAAVDGSVGIALLLYARICGLSSSGPFGAAVLKKGLPLSERGKNTGKTTRPSEGQPPFQTEPGIENSAVPARAFNGAIGLAFFSGMAVLALEVAALQMFQLVATISLFTPAAVLFCAIASLGIAAGVFSRFEPVFVSDKRERTIVLILAASGALVVLAPQIFMGIAQRSNWFADNGGVTPFMFKLGAMALLTLGPAWLVAGLVFPFAVATAGRHCSATQSGQRVGLLLAVNGLGGLLGAELTYRVLLPVCGVYGSMATIGLAFATIALALSLLPSWRAAHLGARFSAIGSISVVLFMSLANSFLPVVNPPPSLVPIDIQSGREGTVAVIKSRQGDLSILVANQYTLGGTSVRYDQERQVLLPVVLHESPQKIGCIGLATGITPGAALSVPSVQEVTSIEISPLVAKAAESYFQEFNHNICRSDSASVVVGDGRTYIASTTGSFDIITGDLFLPWEPGTARLYSIEHFASVRRALKTGGIFCQWLPMYQLTPEQFRLIANTFASEFGETHLFMNNFRVKAPMLALVGGKESGCLDWQRVSKTCAHLRESGAIRDPVLRHESGVRLLYLGPWQTKQPESRRVSLADPSLEYSAATVRLSKDPGKQYFNPANWVQFCRSRQQISADAPESETSAQPELMMLATGLLELNYARRTRHKLADSIALRVSQTIPRCIMDDRLADWERWPGTPVMRGVSNRTQPHSNQYNSTDKGTLK